jgi:hypothetical protein
MRKGLNSLIILVAWQFWKLRNSCVFEGSRPCVQNVVLASGRGRAHLVLGWVFSPPRPAVSAPLGVSTVIR